MAAQGSAASGLRRRRPTARTSTSSKTLYVGLDAIVGDTLRGSGQDDLLVVMSDHGFASWRRSFHLNSWLRDNGYLVARPAFDAADSGPFGDVDWSRTRAYALGLNGLYMNVKGREQHGIVDPEDREALVARLRPSC